MPHVTASADLAALTLGERIDADFAAVCEIVGKAWPYILADIATGAGIHGYVPADFMASFMGRGAWWAVPLAVVIGVPMYTNAAGVIPIVQALLAKGAGLGTVLAFMMSCPFRVQNCTPTLNRVFMESVIALSAPEMIIRRKMLKPRLIATFVGFVVTGILLLASVFNAVL